MKILLSVCCALLIAGSATAQDGQEAKDAQEIIAQIKKNSEETKKSLKQPIGQNSSKGTHDFWSSGGLLVDLSPNFTYEFDSFNLSPKHITVISLVPGKAAVAAFYNEGSFKPTNSAKVDHYLCRVSIVYVKEDGSWKARHSHFSPVQGGAGTTQTSAND